jgi:hypothetical protein
MSTEMIPGHIQPFGCILTFFLRHWRKLLAAALFLCLAAASRFAYVGWRNFQVRRAMGIFATISSDYGALAKFGDRHRSMAIGALASFAAGNYESLSGNFDSAAAAYGRGGPLKAGKLDGMAAICEALCHARSGDTPNAEKILFSVATNCSQTNFVRAAAYYFKALIAWGNGQRQVASEALDAMWQLQETGPLAGRAMLLSMAIR